MMQSYDQQLDEHITVMQGLTALEPTVKHVAQQWIEAINNGGKILLMGNGGSAADAQHIAAELVGRYLCERAGLPAMALTTDTSILTAASNDFGFEHVFARQIEALAQAQDVVVIYSTSGNSANACSAAKVAKSKGCYTVALTGSGGGKLLSMVDDCLCVPSTDTPRIQEAHAFLGHLLCAIVDDHFKN